MYEIEIAILMVGLVSVLFGWNLIPNALATNQRAILKIISLASLIALTVRLNFWAVA